MKKVFYLAGILSIFYFQNAQAQFGNIGDRIKQKAEQRANQKIDESIDKGLDKTEEGIKDGTKKKEKGESSSKSSDDYKPSKTPADYQEGGGKEGGVTSGGAPAVNTPTNFKAYSKFDFKAGENILAFEDFSQDAVGDYPAKWNTNAQGEVVTLENKPGKWLQLRQGMHLPEFMAKLPENFTLEFDIHFDLSKGYWLNHLDLELTDGGKTASFDNSNKNQFSASLYKYFSQLIVKSKVADGNAIDNDLKTGFDFENSPVSNEPLHISIWRQKQRIRLWVNERKIIDLPRALSATAAYNILRFDVKAEEEAAFYLGNLKLAVGAPDLRTKFLTEGKFSTTGIYFDSGKDKVLPNSYAVISDMAKVLSENPAVKVKIIGHTDADGNATSNVELSKKRAEAVKSVLTTEFGISAARISTDGKGAAVPVGSNTNAQGKAQNRRVEFVKL